MEQQVKYIKLKDLVLWTENPRDPFDKNATDQEVAERALANPQKKWNLENLAREMGAYYDFSELPTVVYHDGKPVVYDGNRRIILGKIKHGFVTIPGAANIKIPDFPEEIPCNVCTQRIALYNVFRKHSGAGSWMPLERDLFLHKFMEEEKSAFLILDEHTGIISKRPYLNQVFVKAEIFNEDGLRSLGFTIHSGKLHSFHSNEEALAVLEDIANKIESKTITTRKNRGRVLDVLDVSSRKIIDTNKNKTPQPYTSYVEANEPEDKKQQRQARRIARRETELFGGRLYLRPGEVSNLYRDIVDLYQFYMDNKSQLSQSFPGLIRMALRLLCETAAKDQQKQLDKYLKAHYSEAKKLLDQDSKTTLASQNVTEDSITQLLHTGAHTYQSSSNIEQTIAMSVIIGAILTNTHGQG